MVIGRDEFGRFLRYVLVVHVLPVWRCGRGVRTCTDGLYLHMRAVKLRSPSRRRERESALARIERVSALAER